jgi:hypothetical protein
VKFLGSVCARMGAAHADIAALAIRTVKVAVAISRSSMPQPP